jgi:predicted  nucleic acid-binding Zn-ribbon protein
MSVEGYHDTLERRLHDIETRIHHANEKLSHGTPREEVEAAGELEMLKQRKARVRERLEQLREAEKSGDAGGGSTALEQEVEDLRTAVQRWMEKF